MKSEIVRILAEAKDRQTRRLELDHQSKMLKVEEDELKAQLILAMEKAGLNSLSVAEGDAYLETKQKPYIVDFGELEEYIIKNRATDLLQKRLTESAVKLRWEDGIRIPGVGLINETKLTLK